MESIAPGRTGARRAIAIAIACAACQGQAVAPAPGAGPASGAPAHDATESLDAAVAGDARGSAAAAGRESAAATEDETPDPGRVIAELGAIPAWQAVVDRAQLLGRRGQHGVVYGRVGPPVMAPAPAGTVPSALPAAAGSGAGSGSAAAGSGAGSGSAAPEAGLVATPYAWLVDDTQGNGALGIRIALGDKAAPGDRIAAGGAWQLDAERRWYWKPDAVQHLPPAPASEPRDPPTPAPSHTIATGPLPVGARTAGLARDNDAIYFQIVGPAPQSDGDGWPIAAQLGSPAVLVLNLPGERASYGGQDMRAPDERWQLRRGQTYWVRIGVLHKRTGKPATVNARTAPVRVL